MSEIGDRLRGMLDQTESTDLDRIVRHEPVLPVWRVVRALAYVTAVLVVMAVSVLVLVSGGEDETAVQPSTSSTIANPEISWTQHPLPDEFRVHTLAAAGDRIFGLAFDEIESPNPRTRLWVSDDGVSWEAIDVNTTRFGMRAGYFQQVAQVGDRFLGIVKGELLDSRLVDFRLVVSEDAVTWEPVDTGGGIPIGIAGGDIGGIALIGFDDPDARYRYEVLHSVDGVGWTSSTSPEFERMGPFQPVEFINGRYYISASADSGPARLVTSADASAWRSWPAPAVDRIHSLSPGSVAGELILLTLDNRRSRTWRFDLAGEWIETTPLGFEPRPINPFPSNPILSDPSTGRVAAIVDFGRSGGPSDPDFYEPSEVWWTLDGEKWQAVTGFDAFGSEGVVDAAAVSGTTIVVVHYTHPDGLGSLWTGEVRWPDSPTGSTTTTLVVASSSTTTADASGDLPVFGVGSVDAVFDGGSAARTDRGISYELQWRTSGGFVEIWGMSAGPEVFAASVSDGAEDEQKTSVSVRGYDGFHWSTDAWAVYTWYQPGGFVRLRMSPWLAESADEILTSLIELSDEQVAELTGGWYEERIGSPPPGWDLLAVINGIDQLRPFDVIEIGEGIRGIEIAEDPNLQMRYAALQVSECEVLRINTQLSALGTRYEAPGIRETNADPFDAYASLLIGDRLVILHLIATCGEEWTFTYTSGELMAFAEDIASLYELLNEGPR